MSQFKQEDVKGVIRNKDDTYTALLNNGERKVLDAGTTGTLLNRLDKDRSKMEREGTQASEREREREYESNRRYDPEKRAKERYERDQAMRRELARRR